MVIPAYDDYRERYLTRTAEMVRTIGTIHDFVGRTGDEEEDTSKRHLQIIEATKMGSSCHGAACKGSFNRSIL